jgi:hypothetical protein
MLLFVGIGSTPKARFFSHDKLEVRGATSGSPRTGEGHPSSRAAVLVDQAVEDVYPLDLERGARGVHRSGGHRCRNVETNPSMRPASV